MKKSSEKPAEVSTFKVGDKVIWTHIDVVGQGQVGKIVGLYEHGPYDYWFQQDGYKATAPVYTDELTPITKLHKILA